MKDIVTLDARACEGLERVLELPQCRRFARSEVKDFQTSLSGIDHWNPIQFTDFVAHADLHIWKERVQFSQLLAFLQHLMLRKMLTYQDLPGRLVVPDNLKGYLGVVSDNAREITLHAFHRGEKECTLANLGTTSHYGVFISRTQWVFWHLDPNNKLSVAANPPLPIH